jgi:hypothetical protein
VRAGTVRAGTVRAGRVTAGAVRAGVAPAGTETCRSTASLADAVAGGRSGAPGGVPADESAIPVATIAATAPSTPTVIAVREARLSAFIARS